MAINPYEYFKYLHQGHRTIQLESVVALFVTLWLGNLKKFDCAFHLPQIIRKCSQIGLVIAKPALGILVQKFLSLSFESLVVVVLGERSLCKYAQACVPSGDGCNSQGNNPHRSTPVIKLTKASTAYPEWTESFAVTCCGTSSKLDLLRAPVPYS